jgi:hypothetical protein
VQGREEMRVVPWIQGGCSHCLYNIKRPVQINHVADERMAKWDMKSGFQEGSVFYFLYGLIPLKVKFVEGRFCGLC